MEGREHKNHSHTQPPAKVTASNADTIIHKGFYSRSSLLADTVIGGVLLNTLVKNGYKRGNIDLEVVCIVGGKRIHAVGELDAQGQHLRSSPCGWITKLAMGGQNIPGIICISVEAEVCSVKAIGVILRYPRGSKIA